MTTVNELNTATEAAVAKRGRKSIFEKRDALVAALRAIRNGDSEADAMPSYFIQRQLAERGLVQFTPVQTGRRGRPAHDVSLTDAGIAELAQV